jgi:hypothetical protein
VVALKRGYYANWSRRLGTIEGLRPGENKILEGKIVAFSQDGSRLSETLLPPSLLSPSTFVKEVCVKPMGELAKKKLDAYRDTLKARQIPRDYKGEKPLNRVISP